MTEKSYLELIGRLPLRDKLLLIVAPYMPLTIQRKIVMKYLPFLISVALELGMKKAKEEMGDEVFQKVLDSLPTEIKDKDGTWTLPPGTSQEEIAEFLIRLRERGVEILDKKVNGG